MQDGQNETGGPGGPAGNGHSQAWERELLTRLAMSSINEQRRARRWRIFFVLLAFIYVGFIMVLIARPGLQHGVGDGEHTAVVNVHGIIAPDRPASAEAVIEGLRNAFENKNTRGVVLRINSPGGSPVQAGYVYDEMLRLRNEHPDIPLYAVIEDMGASGGYYIAAGAEKIYADEASIVGSIGVRMGGFGFVEAMDKIGVERRLLTAGDNKALVDPFLPVDEAAQEHLQAMLDEIHEQFISVVESQRGDHLTDKEKLFSGLVWTGERGLDLGLVDALGSVDYVAREVVGEEAVRDFTRREDLLTRLTRNVSTTLVQALEDEVRPGLESMATQ
jgi:protease-4